MLPCPSRPVNSMTANAVPTAKTLHALHEEGNQLFDDGHVAEASRVFNTAVDRFLSDRRSGKAEVEEFVKVAGNLCVCYHALKEWNACVTTARELLAIYPIIPKAYAAIGMCIVSRLLEQEAEQQSEDLLHSPSILPRSGEELRRDARRYLVKLGGILCTPDDAHAYLCRAILLSNATLQVSVGPYLEAAVRWISEELLSAGLSLEREYGDGVLGELSALEDTLTSAVPLLGTAPVHVERQSIRVLDAAEMHAASAAGNASNGGGGGSAAGSMMGRRVEELPDAEAEAVLRTVREGQQTATTATDGGERDDTASHNGSSNNNTAVSSSHFPIDFLLSRERIGVHVCHAERGGIPRGVTLARASGPFAVAQHVQQAPPPSELTLSSPAYGAADSPTPQANDRQLAPLHVDPTGYGDHDDEEAVRTLTAHAAQTLSFGALSSGAAPEIPPLLMCNACGKELSLQELASCPPTGCATCNGVVYCSAACETVYRPRHERHECDLRVALQRRVEKLAAAQDSATSTSESAAPAGEVVPGAAWDALELHRRVLPLCISVYSGLQSSAAGAELVRARVLLGAQRGLVHALPDEVDQTLRQWVETGKVDVLLGATDEPHNDADEETRVSRGHTTAASAPTTHPVSNASSSALELLYAVFFLCRLLSEVHPEGRSSLFYTERLLLRHSCEPNCVWSDTLHGILTARYICKDEELTMALDDQFPQHWPWQIRQKWFVYHHGAPCQCARCLREGEDLNYTRGTLSNALVEQLLTADVLGHPCPTPEHQHPTHLYHRQVQRVVEMSKAPQRNVPALLGRVDALREELNRYVLPSHYLLEDLRRVVLAAMEADGNVNVCTAEGQSSLLFWEALWSGAIPAKRVRIRVLPSVFECGRRRRLHPQQQRRRRRVSAVAGGSAGASSAAASATETRGEGTDAALSASVSSPTEGLQGSECRTPSPPSVTARTTPARSSHEDASKQRPSSASETEGAVASAIATGAPTRAVQPTPLVATKDFSAGSNIVELFYGSYQTWYM